MKSITKNIFDCQTATPLRVDSRRYCSGCDANNIDEAGHWYLEPENIQKYRTSSPSRVTAFSIHWHHITVSLSGQVCPVVVVRRWEAAVEGVLSVF